MAIDRNKTIPAKWDKFLNSSRVMKMKDYQRYWYWSLCMEAQFTDRPGYLPNDMRTLYKLAGCTASFKFFEQEFGCVRECFHVVKDDVRWLCQDTALEIALAIEEKSTKARSSRTNVDRTINVAISSNPLLSIYMDYPKKTAKAKAMKAIAKAIKYLAIVEKLPELDAAQLIHSRVIEFAKSDAGRDGGLFDGYTCPYPASWFNAERYLDDPATWERKNGQDQPAGIAVSRQTARNRSNREKLTKSIFGVDAGGDAGPGGGTGEVRAYGKRDRVLEAASSRIPGNTD